MHVLSLVDVEGSLILLVRDRVSFLRTDHHLVAHHVVVHYVFQRGLKSLWVDQIEINQLVSCDLDPYVSSDEIDKTSDVDLAIELPLHYLCHFIPDLLEEENFT